MSQLQTKAKVPTAKPQADVFTVLLATAALALGVTAGFVIWNLTTAYGLEFGEIFQPLSV